MAGGPSLRSGIGRLPLARGTPRPNGLEGGVPLGVWAPWSAASLWFLGSERCLLSSLEFREHWGNLSPLLLAPAFRVGKQLLSLFPPLTGLCKNSRAPEPSSAAPLPWAWCGPKNTRRSGAWLRVRAGPAGPQRASGDRGTGGRLVPRLGGAVPLNPGGGKERKEEKKTGAPSRWWRCPAPHSAPTPGPACGPPPPPAQGAPRSTAPCHRACQNRMKPSRGGG